MVRIASLGSVTTLLSVEREFDSGFETVSSRPTVVDQTTVQISAASIDSSSSPATTPPERGVDEDVGSVVGP